MYDNDYLPIEECERLRRQKLSEDLSVPKLPLRESPMRAQRGRKPELGSHYGGQFVIPPDDGDDEEPEEGDESGDQSLHPDYLKGHSHGLLGKERGKGLALSGYYDLGYQHGADIRKKMAKEIQDNQGTPGESVNRKEAFEPANQSTPEVPIIGKTGLNHDFSQYGLNKEDTGTMHRIVEDKLFAHATKVSRGKTPNPTFDEDDSAWLTKLAGLRESAKKIISQFGLKLSEEQ